MTTVWDWDYAFEILPDLLEGFVVTIQATLLGCVVAFALGLVIAFARRVGPRPVTVPMQAFVEFVRSTPLIVQLFFLFYVLPSWGVTLSPMTAGVLGLGLHYATYTSEVYRAGIDGVPKGQWEAATALSLPTRRVWVAIVLPQAIRNVTPALGNYAISMFKEVPLLLAIGVMCMVGVAKEVGSQNFRYIEPYTLCGVIFLLASYPTSLLVRRLEKRLAH
ncbi:MAG: ectoine/hydroxyectoine ABC transporter permease subunit EhuD [Actinomycetes bacterium]